MAVTSENTQPPGQEPNEKKRPSLFRRAPVMFGLGAVSGGVIISIILALLNPYNPLSSTFPKESGEDMKHTFKLRRIQPYRPETKAIIHDYEALKAYIDTLNFNTLYDNITAMDGGVKPDTTNGDTRYKRGVGFYFGMADRKRDYIYDNPNENKTYLLKANSLTVVLYPVYYNEKDTPVPTKDFYWSAPLYAATVKPPTYKRLLSIKTDFDPPTKKSAAFRDPENVPFDLGHTSP